MVSRIYKELLKTNKKNTNKSVERQQNNDYQDTKEDQKAINTECSIADDNIEKWKLRVHIGTILVSNWRH